MNSKRRELFMIIGVLAFLILVPAAFADAISASGRHVIDTDIESGDHVWDDTSQTYDIPNGIDIESGASLTIMPGVTVRLGDTADLVVDGTLKVLGSSSSPVTFTGITQTPGYWLQILIRGQFDARNSACILRHAVFEYGGKDLTGIGYTMGMLSAQYADIDVRDCVFRNSNSCGVLLQSGSSLQMDSCHFENNAAYPVCFFGNAQMATVVEDSTLRKLTATGNLSDGVAFAEAYLYMIDEYVLENTGLPYYVVNGFGVTEGRMIVEPDVVVYFHESSGLMLDGGPLLALGTSDHPIQFFGMEESDGSWEGVSIAGTWEFDFGGPEPIKWTYNPGSVLEHVEIAYGGRLNANLNLDHASALLRFCTIRNSGKHGIEQAYADGTTVERCKIYDNQQSGAYKSSSDEGKILAIHNWWGDARGPYDADDNPAGTGNAIVNDAAWFIPFLTSPDQDPNDADVVELLSMTIEPTRWFVPANGATQLEAIITVYDGMGNALPGYQVRMDSNLGTVTDGDITNINGIARAYVSSDTPGEATLTPRLELASTYPSRADSADVVFTTPTASLDFLPDREAPYVNRNIDIGPLPLTVGVPAQITVDVTNPSDSDVQMEIQIGKHNYGIGLPLEILDTQNHLLPANSSLEVVSNWTPTAPGHQCIGLYGYFTLPENVHNPALEIQLAESDFELPWLHNMHPSGLSLAELYAKQGSERVKKAVDAFETLSSAPTMIADPLGFLAGFLPGKMASLMLGQIMDMWEKALNALRTDPPRQDFREFAEIKSYDFPPISAGNGISQARADAANTLMEKSLDLFAKLQAVEITIDRYGGAAMAEEQTWASQQATTLIHYLDLTGHSMIETADAMDAYVAVLRNEGIEEISIDKSAYEAMQQRLAAGNYSSEERQAAQWLELTDAQLADWKNAILAADPDELATRNALDDMEDLADEMRDLGESMIDPENFSPGTLIGMVRSRDGSTSNNLMRAYQIEQSFPVYNPLDGSADIEMKVRRIGMPSDWMVRISPSEFTLDSGSQTTVTCTITPGAEIPQGLNPTTAIEAWAGGTLLGGVTIESYAPKPGLPIRAYLLGHVSLSDREVEELDLNQDGQVDVADLLKFILQNQ
ncbi:MAG: Ig-like domain-containing protein [Candidatus Sumerlaeia bacterium]